MSAAEILQAETLRLESGGELRVEKRFGQKDGALRLRLAGPQECVLHWGVTRAGSNAWQAPPASSWPPGARAAGPAAVDAPFQLADGAREISIRFAEPIPSATLEFALFFPQAGHWDNNHGRNYQIALPFGPTGAPLEPVWRERLRGQDVLFERKFELKGGARLAAAVTEAAGRSSVHLLLDAPGEMVLHWGVARYSSGDWLLPPPSMRPPNSAVWENKSVRTPFTQHQGLSQLDVELPPDDRPLGLVFVLQEIRSGCWLNFKGQNFYLPTNFDFQRHAGSDSALLDEMIQQIAQAETGKNSWTLMHRFNLCYDLLDRAGDSLDGLALMFVWLRFSAIRQLTWQRNYNTKPRELSHAQDRLTQRLAEIYARQPSLRPLLRLSLATLGPGGEGQRVRDEILNIMHRHRVKETSGHFLEEWHQKLHNNTTPDDIVICGAFLEFLRSDGDPARFYEKLQAGGVSKQRLESFERPIRSAPNFAPHLKEALIGEFENFLRILKSVHEGTDLDTAIRGAAGWLDPESERSMDALAKRRGDLASAVAEAARLVAQVRAGIHRILAQGRPARPLLYLDLALEQWLRAVVEQNIQQPLSAERWAELVELTLQNLNFSDPDPELEICREHWRRLLPITGDPPDAALHAKAVLDRIGRVLGEWIDRMYRLLQPKAEWLGNAVHAESWAITLFSEEVARGASLGWVLAALVRRLDPLLRARAGIGKWQVVSRGAGRGVVEVVKQLRELQGRDLAAPRVVLADQVMGDEEIPEGVRAVIAPNVTDIVSHVAVRARNANLMFASCHDPELFAQLKSLRGQMVMARINPAGDVEIQPCAGEAAAEKAPAHRRKLAPIHPRFSRWIVLPESFDEQCVGRKSINLENLRRRLPKEIRAPRSVAVPFGAFEQALSLRANQRRAQELARLAGALDKNPAEPLGQIRELVLGLAPPPEFAPALADGLTNGGIALPQSLDSLWRAVTQVWASKWNERAYLNRRSAGIRDEELFMAALIQEVVPAEYAFVLHTANPFRDRPHELYGEVVLGLGETLVGNYPGRALGFLWDKKQEKTALLAYPNKSVGLFGAGWICRSDSNAEDLGEYAGAGLYDSVATPAPRQTMLNYANERLLWDAAWRESFLRALGRLGAQIEQALGAPQDVEGAYAAGERFVVQSRPQMGSSHG